MAVQRWETGRGSRRQGIPGGPIAEVVIGTDAGTNVGVVDVTVPAGAVMPEHAHGDSETLLVPQAGRLRLVDADSGDVTELVPGVLATIAVGQRVRLENLEAAEGRMLVIIAPPTFADELVAWPVVT